MRRFFTVAVGVVALVTTAQAQWVVPHTTTHQHNVPHTTTHTPTMSSMATMSMQCLIQQRTSTAFLTPPRISIKLRLTAINRS